MGQEQYDNKAASGEQSEGEYNIFRDSLMRYMGYANEVGESFRYQVSSSIYGLLFLLIQFIEDS